MQTQVTTQEDFTAVSHCKKLIFYMNPLLLLNDTLVYGNYDEQSHVSVAGAYLWGPYSFIMRLYPEFVIHILPHRKLIKISHPSLQLVSNFRNSSSSLVLCYNTLNTYRLMLLAPNLGNTITGGQETFIHCRIHSSEMSSNCTVLS
jgi:hypothetical protein